MTKSVLAACIAIAFLTMANLGSAWAQSGEEMIELKSEIEALKKGQEQMQEDISAIRKILEEAVRPRAQARAQQPFEPVDLTVGASPFLGAANAPVTLVEYSDYQCPFCRRHFSTVMPELVKAYVDTGKVKYVMREFPIQSIHPQALKASQAALCAGALGKYWEMHDLIFGNQRQIAVEHLKAHGQSLGLDSASFEDCLAGDSYVEQIRSDLAEGQKLGIRGTPSFLLGATDAADPNKVKVTKLIRGAVPLVTFTQVLEEILSDAAEPKDEES
jgi:protein-disulfide isomerase